MRYLHPVQAHERFLASGRYRFSKDGQALEKSEAWTVHGLPDGETFWRVDLDARAGEGKSILAEALLGADGALARLDIRYENANFEGGIKQLSATYQLMDGLLQVGYTLNGAARAYREMALPPQVHIDIPLLIFRGGTIRALAQAGAALVPLFVPLFEHAQLFPGALQSVSSPVEYAGEDKLRLGQRVMPTRLYRYRDQAALYWLDSHGLIVKRRKAYKQQEFLVEISNYAAPRANYLNYLR